MKAKVFCIGSHKTGTTSLEVALKKLGYRVTGGFGTKDTFGNAATGGKTILGG